MQKLLVIAILLVNIFKLSYSSGKLWWVSFSLNTHAKASSPTFLARAISSTCSPLTATIEASSSTTIGKSSSADSKEETRKSAWVQILFHTQHSLRLLSKSVFFLHYHYIYLLKFEVKSSLMTPSSPPRPQDFHRCWKQMDDCNFHILYLKIRFLKKSINLANDRNKS